MRCLIQTCDAERMRIVQEGFEKRVYSRLERRWAGASPPGRLCPGGEAVCLAVHQVFRLLL